MTNEAPMQDSELAPADIRELTSADAVAAFFARLGYDTNVRIRQDAANLGITAPGTLKPIKKIELLANQDNLLQVYLFELTSVTVTHTRALARQFLKFGGDFLLVLTSDYDRIDFVLLEKFTPAKQHATGTPVSQRTASRPRVLTVDRKNPSNVNLRVLKRFTYTESDAILQYDKILSAYSIADWSEEFFNNRALFSDYYLKERLPSLPDWEQAKAEIKPAFKQLSDLYLRASSNWAGKPEAEIRAGLFEPVFNVLGFKAKAINPAKSDSPEADFLLSGPGKAPLAACLTYSWGRYLDGKGNERDIDRPEENPGAKVVSLLEADDSPAWVIVTNGQTWRLYSQKTHSKATNYFEIDLDEALTTGPDSFPYFWLFFRRPAFEPETMLREGQERTLSFLDRVLADSEVYAKELGERLKGRVFTEIFPHLAEGFITAIKRADGRDADLSQERLDEIFQGTLTLLYRLLFLLYAEARNLLPASEVRGYYDASLATIKQEVAAAAGPIEDEVEGKLKKQYGAGAFSIHDRLNRLFQIVDAGDPAVNVPMYNGGLFLTDPPADDDSAEGRSARFLKDHQVPDYFLARAIDLLARDEDDRRHDLVLIDYKSLGVRQLGSIYEGLLEFKLRIADKKLGVTKEKGREVYVPFADLDERQQARAERQGDVVKKGHPYLENDKRERKATGSYYTPDYIVKYIVQNAVGPVLKGKFDALRPKLREAEKAHRDAIKRAQGFEKKGMQGDDPEKVANSYRHLVDELFDVKTLDPAMGSGHFLVEAVDFISDKAIDFLNAFPWNPVNKFLNDTRETILSAMVEQGIDIDKNRLTDVNLLKRHVLKRCIFGVDLNPMAVELAKVSLWLHCFTLGAPLSFLDHHIKCGNSLVGVTIEEITKKLAGDQNLQLNLFDRVNLSNQLKAVRLMQEVGELSDVTPAMVRESKKKFNEANRQLVPARRILDLFASRWFGNEPQTTGRGRNRSVEDKVLVLLQTTMGEKWITKGTAPSMETYKKVIEVAENAAEANHFFHWEIEFPEVFFGPSPATAQVMERIEDGGFDAVVGNPPYVRQESIHDKVEKFLRDHYEVFQSTADLYSYFIERGVTRLTSGGHFAYIVANKWMRANYGEPLRRWLKQQQVKLIVDFGDLPVFGEVTTYPCIPIVVKTSDVQTEMPVCQVKTLDFNDLKEYVANNCHQVQKQKLDDRGWSLSDKKKQDLLDKIKAAGIPLGEYINGKIYYGIKTGLNEAFVIDAETRKRLIKEDPKCKEIIKPFLAGRDIKRYTPPVSDNYLILFPDKWTRSNCDDLKKAWSWLKSKYPSIAGHLSQFEDKAKARYDQGEFWWELRECTYYDIFSNSRIIVPCISQNASYTLCSHLALSNDKTSVIKTSDISLLGILNSSVIDFYIHSICATKTGGYYEYKPMYIEQLHIPKLPPDLSGKIAELATKLILNENCTEHENTINHLLYKHYQLSQVEIDLIERHFSKK